MKKFSYRMESVLKYRKFREKRAILKLMEMRKAHDMIEKKITGLKNEKIEVAERCRSESFQGIDAPLYKTYTSYLGSLSAGIKNAAAELEDKRIALKQQEAVLKSETIKKKALETHRKSLFDAHTVKVGKEEQKLLDEMIIIRQEMNV